jgi:hypothetical protein
MEQDQLVKKGHEVIRHAQDTRPKKALCLFLFPNVMHNWGSPSMFHKVFYEWLALE